MRATPTRHWILVLASPGLCLRASTPPVMAASNDPQVSRRSAVALAAALAATAVTAAAAYGGLAHWQSQGRTPHPAVQVVQQAAPPQFVEDAE